MINRQLNYGRHHIINFAREEAQSAPCCTPRSSLSILDLGAGSGTDLLNVKKAVEDTGAVQNLQLFAIENNPKNAEKLKNQGILVSSIDIEHDVFPYDDSTFDIVCANQILEHTKELFWITSEVSRILNPPTVRKLTYHAKTQDFSRQNQTRKVERWERTPEGEASS